MRFNGIFIALALMTGTVASSFSFSAEVPAELKGVGIQEHLGDKVSIHDLTFTDETGKEVKLDTYFKSGRPVLLSLVYYGCSNLCTFVLNGMVDSLKTMSWVPGNQFEVVSVSIDPTETPELAAKKKAAYIDSLGRVGAETGWHFLVGKEDQIKKLADQLGFGFKKNPEDGQYAHGAVIFALTPDGKISRYLYGIEWPEKTLRLALLEASNGKIGTIVDRFLLFCYRYDPQTRKYSIYLTKLMQAGGAGTVVAFGGYLAVFWRRQRRGNRALAKADPENV